MRLSRRWAIVGTSALVLGGAGVGTGLGLAGGDDGDARATGPAADQAAAAALERIPGGTVTGLERDSENGAAWEVEVRRPDGATVDVRLGADQRVIVVEGDRESAGEDGSR